MELLDPKGNREQSFEYQSRASELGYWLAEGTFGALLLGNGAHKDVQSGLRWIRKGAEDGDWVAQNTLAMVLWRGDLGVQRDKNQAVKWLKASAQSGLDDSQAMLGSLYASGDQVPRDLRLARFWLSLAAEKGHPGAQKLLERLERE